MMDLDKKISEIINQNDFMKGSFFYRLQNGEMSKEEFLETQRQFYHAVVGFSSPLSYIAAKIPNIEQRMRIVKNIWEEHGEGDASKCHGATFMEFMNRMNDHKEVEVAAPKKEVMLFNSTLNGICMNEHYLVGVGILGMIEHMFSEISSFIGVVVVERGWIKTEEMIHYSLHQELDCIHAEDFFAILRPNLGNKESEELIEKGLSLGNLIFLSFYENLAKMK